MHQHLSHQSELTYVSSIQEWKVNKGVQSQQICRSQNTRIPQAVRGMGVGYLLNLKEDTSPEEGVLTKGNSNSMQKAYQVRGYLVSDKRQQLLLGHVFIYHLQHFMAFFLDDISSTNLWHIYYCYQF